MRTRTLLLAALLGLAATPARALDRLGDPWVSLWGFSSMTGGYRSTRAEFGSRMGPTGRYQLFGSVKTWRFRDGPAGGMVEYAAGLKRELYHVSVSGRLGTAPPNNQRTRYHLAQGDVLMTFYGLVAGPEQPEHSAAIWESSGPVPAPESLDREWVTRVHARYTNINNHLDRASGLSPLIVIENVWQFDVSETWREKTTLSGQYAFDRYQRILSNQSEAIFKDDIDFPGNAFPIFGWPNNWGSASLRRDFGKDVEAWAAGTRLNLLNNQLEVLYGFGAGLRPKKGWGAAAGVFHRHRRRGISRDGVSLEASYRW